MKCKVCGEPTPIYFKANGGVRYRLTCSDKCRGMIVAKNRNPNKAKMKRRAAQKAALAMLRAKNANPGTK